MLLAACGHTYRASIGVSRRGDHVFGGQVAIEARAHAVVTTAGRAILTMPLGVRAGFGVDGDGDARAILQVVGGFGLLPRGRGPEATVEGRAGVDSLGGALSLGIAWSGPAGRTAVHLLPDAPIPLDRLELRELGLVLGADRDLPADGIPARLSLDVYAGRGATSMP